MTRLKGKVKSISVKEVTEGMQVGWEGVNRFHFGKTEKVVDKVYVKVNLETTNGHDTVPIDLLKTLVVEYGNGVEIGIIEKEGNSLLMKELPKQQMRQLPLKYSQWQSAIDNGEVDSDKEVEFEIKHGFVHGGEGEIVDKFCARYAKIIPQKKRVYSEEEMRLAFEAGRTMQDRVYGNGIENLFLRDKYQFSNWLDKGMKFE